MVAQPTKRCPSSFHVGERELPLEDFHLRKDSKDGRKSWCKKCVAAAYRADPSKQRARSKRWWDKNGEGYKQARRRQYRDDAEYRAAVQIANARWGRANPEKTRANVVRWKAKNPEKWKEMTRRANKRSRGRQRQWAMDNPDKIRAAQRRFRQTQGAKDYLRAQRLIRRAKGTQTNLNKVKLRQKWDYYGGKCWMCGEPAKEMDHVKPISRGGSSLVANLRPACVDCNRRKRNLWPLSVVLEKMDEWLNKR